MFSFLLQSLSGYAPLPPIASSPSSEQSHAPTRVKPIPRLPGVWGKPYEVKKFQHLPVVIEGKESNFSLPRAKSWRKFRAQLRQREQVAQTTPVPTETSAQTQPSRAPTPLLTRKVLQPAPPSAKPSSGVDQERRDRVRARRARRYKAKQTAAQSK